jgi:hypothetical protein
MAPQQQDTNSACGHRQHHRTPPFWQITPLRRGCDTRRPSHKRYCFGLPPPDAGEPIAWNAAAADAACDCGVPAALGVAQGERPEAGDPGATPLAPVVTNKHNRIACFKRRTNKGDTQHE